MPLSRTIVERKRVKKVKLPINPITTPKGFCFPDTSAEERMIGRSGKMQGDKTVTMPARKANEISKIIIFLVNLG